MSTFGIYISVVLIFNLICDLSILHLVCTNLFHFLIAPFSIRFSGSQFEQLRAGPPQLFSVIPIQSTKYNNNRAPISSRHLHHIPSPPIITHHHTLSPTISHQSLPINAHHHPSSPITMHPSSLTISDHHPSLPIISHSRTSSSIPTYLPHHHPSSPIFTNTTYHHSLKPLFQRFQRNLQKVNVYSHIITVQCLSIKVRFNAVANDNCNTFQNLLFIQMKN